MNLKKHLFLILFFLSLSSFAQKFENLALTPPMGWNSWNHFACDINETIVREMADAMVSSGMNDAGYEYINIDDCWQGLRDSLGFIHPDKTRFPSGMKALADYIHSKGLKLGIYSDAGWKTCGGCSGSRGYEYQDALQYAKWGIDYLKYDWCNTTGLNAEGAYLTIRDAIYQAGRPMVLSICEWGDNQPWEWAKDIGHLWRTTGDIYNCFDCVYDHGTWNSWGVLQILDMRDNSMLRKVAGPGHWNDPDMMEVGNGMSVNEDRAHFSMWCMLAAPLIAGNDLRKINLPTLEILTNPHAIAINQDALGIQGYKHGVVSNVDVWVKPLINNEFAVCFLNRSVEPASIVFDWKNNPFNDEYSQQSANFDMEVYALFNIWESKSDGNTQKSLKTVIPGHDVLMYRLKKSKN
ncbi:MAG: alpha-galactosidase [Bacteroidetes bacterium HGW-Bacteroidetes-4]|jgi:alpha-galactosidase|nr:MAG: alpha-galactosidase [Bacteroidetes bacterium HGW-Bacteroidetes-4]